MSGGEKVPKGLKKASKMVSECPDECPKKKASLQKYNSNTDDISQKTAQSPIKAEKTSLKKPRFLLLKSRQS
jgi:hypothetical protein